MKIILLQDIPKLGQRNDIKDVRDGYARNFLFPRGLARPATEGVLRELAARSARAERQKSEEYQRQRAWLDQLKTLVLHFTVKVGEKGRAYGSVTAVKIRDALKKQGILVEKEWVQLKEPIKTTGERKIAIKFPPELKGEVTVTVEAE